MVVGELVMGKGTLMGTIIATGTHMEEIEDTKVHMAAVAGVIRVRQPLKSETRLCSKTPLETKLTMQAQLNSICSRCKQRSKVTTSQEGRLITTLTMLTTTGTRATELEWINTMLNNSTMLREQVNTGRTLTADKLMRIISSNMLISMVNSTTLDTITDSSSLDNISVDRSKQVGHMERALKQRHMSKPKTKEVIRTRSGIESPRILEQKDNVSMISEVGLKVSEQL